MAVSLSQDVEWFADRFDDPPRRLHSRAIDDGSAWGAPAYSRAMEQWIGSRPTDTTSTEIEVACLHYGGDRATCPDCKGLGVKTLIVTRFRWPMRAALALLRKKVHAAPGVVHPAILLYRLAICDFNVEACCASVGLPQSRGESEIEAAIWLLRPLYSETPIGRPRRISESQSIAERAAVAA